MVLKSPEPVDMDEIQFDGFVSDVSFNELFYNKDNKIMQPHNDMNDQYERFRTQNFI